MDAYWANTGYVGWTAAGLLVLATLLTWFTVSGPFIGSMSASGVDTDDGKVALALAVSLGAFALKANRMWLGICGVVAVVFYGYEFFNVASFDVAGDAESEFEQSFADAFNVNPGFGLYLGLFTGVALAGWGLVYPHLQKRKADEAPADAPRSASSE